jgi:hypothetical protein
MPTPGSCTRQHSPVPIPNYLHEDVVAVGAVLNGVRDDVVEYPLEPLAFKGLIGDERRWRLRMFLATWVVTESRDLGWAAALNPDPAHDREAKVILAGIGDDAFRDSVLSRPNPPVTDSAEERPVDGPPSATRETPNEFWDRLLAESRGQPTTVSRATVLVRPASSRGRP